MSAYKVVITDFADPDCSLEAEQFRAVGLDVELVFPNTRQADQLLPHIVDADALIVQWANISRPLIEAMQRCRVLSRYGIDVLYWQRMRGQLPSSDLYLASLPDFLFSHLCQTSPMIEPSNAMAHGALNLETMSWHEAVLDRLGLAGLRWPIICPLGTIVGHWCWQGRVVPCYAPVGDYQCALASALLQPDELSLNIST